MEEWKEYKAIDFCENVTDGTHDSPRYQDCGHYLITSKHLKNNQIDFSSAKIISEADYQRIIVRSGVEQYDILFSMIGTIGNIVRVIDSEVDFAVKNMGIFKMGKDKHKSSWLYYWLKSTKAEEYMQQQLAGSTQAYLTLNSLRNYPVFYPGKEYAHKVISILSSLDDKIELNQRINDNLEQQATALFDKMFPSITNGNCKIGDWLRPKRGIGLLTKDTILGDVPVVAGGLRPAAYHNKANTLSPVVTISASGANAGYVALWNKPVWSSDSSYIDSSLTSDVYFWYVMLKKRQKEIFDAQTGSAQPHIYPQHIAELPIKQLEKEQIIKYTEQAMPLFKMVGNLTEENIKLAQLRDTLLPKLMSGELKIS